MKLAIIGTGYVGLTTGACLAEAGNAVMCVDIDGKKIENLKKGIIPIYEPGLKKLVQKNLQKKTLSFSTDAKKAIQFAEIVFSAVGTPPGKNHRADLKFVKEVAKEFGKFLNDYKIFVNKSTVPVGTGEICKKIILQEIKNKNLKFSIASNPEFLREGSAIKDTMHPDRIIIGTENSHTALILKKLYKPFKTKIFSTDLKTAEIIKYASNAFLATKISFINEIANFCEIAGGNITKIAEGMGLDKRIGKKFLKAGIGYGGSCFPKDVKALMEMGKSAGYDFKIIKAADEVNEKQALSLFYKLKKIIPAIKGKIIAIWGLSFKPGTDDIREAPSIKIIEKLLEEGCLIQACDPAAIENTKKIFSPTDKKISYHLDPYAAAKNADALLLVTEWGEFKKADLKKVRKLMKGSLLLDGRNFLLAQKISFCNAKILKTEKTAN